MYIYVFDSVKQKSRIDEYKDVKNIHSSALWNWFFLHWVRGVKQSEFAPLVRTA